MTEQDLRQWAEKCPPRGSEPIAGGDELARATLRVLDELAEQRKRTSDGIRLIATERQRQIEGEGWTPEHDDAHIHGEMAQAAACYAVAAGTVPWPWDSKWYKPKDRLSNLVRAGALIVAEIDRLLRRERTKAYAVIQAERPSGVLEWSFDASHGQWLAYGGGGERWRICMSASGEFVGVDGSSPTLAIAQAHCQNHADLIAQKVGP